MPGRERLLRLGRVMWTGPPVGERNPQIDAAGSWLTTAPWPQASTAAISLASGGGMGWPTR
jgi:hypothetical protein